MIDKIISEAAAKAVKELYGIDADPAAIVPQATRKEFEGNLTLVVFPWVKAARKSPEAVGNEIGQWLVDNEPAISGFNVVKGFLNLVVTPTYWNGVLASIESNPNYGVTVAGEDSPLVMVEYSSPNRGAGDDFFRHHAGHPGAGGLCQAGAGLSGIFKAG